jgi:hypothetical protein
MSKVEAMARTHKENRQVFFTLLAELVCNLLKISGRTILACISASFLDNYYDTQACALWKYLKGIDLNSLYKIIKRE